MIELENIETESSKDIDNQENIIEESIINEPILEVENIKDEVALNIDDKELPQEEGKENVNIIDTKIYIDEFATYGKLSEDSYEKIEKAGISRDIVDLYIEGQKALLTLHTNELMAVAGGKDEYNKMVNWAAENLSDSEKDAFNNAVYSSDKSVGMLAVSGLYARYKNQNSFNLGNRIEADNNKIFDTYSSMAEMVRDVQDMRYKQDEAFRKIVAEKAARSFTL